MSSLSKRTEIKPEFISIAADNSFIANNSSPRSVMHSSHVSSRPSLINPDKKFLVTGIEGEFGKYINDVRTDEDIIVKAVIAKRRDLGVYNPETILLVEFERDGELWMDMIEVPNHRSSHGYFGYSLHATDELNDISFNKPIPKGTVLARTDSYAPDGTYMFGVNANVALMSHPSVAEDGFVVSRSLCEKTKFTTVTKRVIYLTKDNLPINLYGGNESFKMIPDIGSPVRPDGLLCATRDRNDWFSIADLNNESISEMDHTFDEAVYVPHNTIVVDVSVMRGNYSKSEYHSEMTTQLDEFAANLISYYTDIVRQYEKVLYDQRRMHGDSFKPRQTPRLRRFIADCMIKRDSPTSKDKLCYRRINIDQYRIEVTCMSVVIPNLGFKFTDLHSAKGVVCRILEDHEMPIDEFGNRADIIADAGSSTISRMNIGRTYEHYLGAMTRDNRQRLNNYYYSMYGGDYLNRINFNDVNYGIEVLRKIYCHINIDMVEFLNGLTVEEQRTHLLEVLTDDMYLYYPTDNEKNIVDVITSLEKTEFKPNLGKVTYTDELGKVVTTKDDVRIGRMYMLLLDRIGIDYSAVSSAKVNNFNFPIKGGQTDRNKHPHSLTPTKTLSETEVRILSSFAKPVLIAELVDLALNPVSHKLLIKHILESEEAYSTNFDIDRVADPYGNTKSLSMLHHIFAAAGFTFEYAENEDFGGVDTNA